MFRPNILVLVLAVAAMAMAGAAHAVTQSPPIPVLKKGEGREVAGKLANVLEQRYTIPAIGRAYAARLRANGAAGRYDALNWKQFCDLLTGDLQAVQPDYHLFVNAGVPASPVAAATAANPIPATESGQWAAPGIAYLRLNRFTGEQSNANRIRKFLIAHQHAKSLILDLRGHEGGRFEEMDAIIPLLYARRTPLLDMAIATAAERESGPLARSPSLQLLPTRGNLTVRRHWAIPDTQVRGLQTARIYVLIAKATASAGEHLADALKISKRATLIGERTGGANHFGGEVQISDHFYAYVPMGRTYDPRTGMDWERSGVAPNVNVPPAQALTVALRSAGVPENKAAEISQRIEGGLAAPAY